MKINVDFEHKLLEITFSNGQTVSVKLNLIKQFLLANLFCTVTWMVTESKELFIKELQEAIDSAEEAEQANVDLSKSNKHE